MKFELTDAETHTSEYLLHKYWARKPHNIVAILIKNLLPQGGRLLDPCCGSGVSLREAAKLGVESTGIDLNPIACLISSVLLDPPNLNDFIKSVSPIINEMENIAKPFYCDNNGVFIKYLIHKINVICDCGNKVHVDTAHKEGKHFLCPSCGKQVIFNLENLIDTTITGYCINGEIRNDRATLSLQKSYSDKFVLENDTSAYTKNFCENRRILAFSGMSTDMLFTKRNFSILAQFMEYFENIENVQVKNAAKLLLTASSAQCSRLIATRNNLSTGGPAWSIPGFWVPKEHLETNPIVHIKARYKKFIKGLEELIKKPLKAKAEVLCANSLVELKNDRYAEAYDLIFLDPPYGDSVPYLEFSTFWNSFLKKVVDVSQDISVSDRDNKQAAWEKYENDLTHLITLCKNSLTTDGCILITFNNNELRAWSSLIKSLQLNGFKCEYASYQMPAVISTKAQKAKESSYISDIYSVYTKNTSTTSKDLKPIISHLKYAATIRGGFISKNICMRIAFVQWLLNNIDHTLICELDSIFKSIFNKKNNILTLKSEYYSDTDLPLRDLCRQKASEILKDGPIKVSKLLLTVCNELHEFGMPDPIEVKEYLQDYPTEKGRYLGAIIPQ